MSVSENELKSFNEFVSQRLQAKAEITLEECVRLWREEQELLEEVRLAMTQIKTGQSWTHEEIKRDLQEFRRQLSDSVSRNE